jgi:hypothetical protein
MSKAVRRLLTNSIPQTLPATAQARLLASVAALRGQGLINQSLVGSRDWEWAAEILLTTRGAEQSKAVAKKLPFHRAVLEAALYIEIGRSRLRDDFPVANSSPRLWLFAASTYAFCNSTSKHGVHSPPVSPPSPCGK